jgi:murein DD-endopeptidase MepM/ murein hydrolase activator NlpD
MRILTSLLTLALCCTLLTHRATAHAQSPDPTPAFTAALDAFNAQIAGETYAIREMKTAGAWAYAIATPATHDADHQPHGFLPLIATFNGEAWAVTIGSQENAAAFNALLVQMPDALLDPSTKDFIAQPTAGVQPLATNNMTSHRLPWRKGLQGFIAQRDGSGHVNQVDFDIQGLVAAGDVVASKAGTVVFAKESSNAGSCDGANFSTVWKQTNVVVVRHSASEYSWYVHLAVNSVPVQVGDAISAGAKIGVEGSTGFACGIHIHYMASSAIPASWTDPANPNVAPWPPAGSITQVDFDEAAWLALAPGTWIASQNDGVPACPAPTLQTPADGATITATTIAVSWNAVSGCAFTNYTARASDAADAGSVITETTTTSLTATLALDPSWQNRDVFVQVRANGVGAAWATRRVRWQPAPPGNYTLFDNVNRAGASFSSRETITQLASVNFDEKARSLQADAGVGVVLCSEPNLRGNCGRAVGAINVNDVNMLAAGLAGNVSSVVACYGACPAAPLTPTLASPVSGSIAFSGNVSLRWNGAGDEYEIEVSAGALTSTLRLGWANGTARSVVLPASDQPYRWRVRAANGYGSGAWAEGSFKVINAAWRVYLPATIR